MPAMLPAGRLHYPEVTRVGQVRRRLIFAGFSVLSVMGMGTFGYYLLGEDAGWSLVDCLYMVLVTLTTVGYTEVLDVRSVEYAELFTMLLLVSGTGVSVYFLSAVTAFIIEGDLREAIWRRRVRGELQKVCDHYIVCGAGETGSSVIEDLVEAGCQVVVIEADPAHIDRLTRRVGGQACIAIEGDATEDEVLHESGLERARGIVATLHTDRDNLFVTVTARQLNPHMRIVSRAVDERAGQKLLRAGADAVVSPNQIGGKRMAREMLHPGVVGFMELIVRAPGKNLTVHEVTIPEGSPVEGLTLATSGIRQASNALVLSVMDPSDGRYTFNPPPGVVLRHGMRLYALGDATVIERLEAHVRG